MRLDKLFRIIPFLIIIALMFGSISYASDSEGGISESTEIISALGYLDSGIKDENITRAEFAGIIVNLLKISADTSAYEWKNKYLSASENIAEKAEERSEFSDVDVSHKYYQAIRAAYTYGIMRGNSDGLFNPDEYISVQDAAVILLRIIGYEELATIRGGYPDGYIGIAAENKMFAKVKVKSFAEPLNAEVLAAVLCNCIDMKLARVTNIRVSGDDSYAELDTESELTFGSEFMNIQKYTGVLTKNTVSSLTDFSNLPADQVEIDDVVYYTTDGILGDTLRYLGRTVDIYYSIDKKNTDVRTIQYMRLSDPENDIEISHKDMIGYSDGKVLYKNGKNTAYCTVAKNVPVVYNGVFLSSYDKNVFDIDCGSVLFSYKKSENVCIIINSYKSYYVAEVNTADETVILTDGDNNINISPKRKNELVLFDSDNKLTQISEITVGSILTAARNGKYTTAYISEKTVTTKINEIDFAEGRIVTDDGDFDVSAQLLSSERMKQISCGYAVTLYFDCFGNVAWADEKQLSDYLSGYIIAFDKDKTTLDSSALLMLYDTSGGKGVITLGTTPTIKLCDVNGATVSCKVDELLSKLSDTYIYYKLNSKGLVSYIELPLSAPGEFGRLYTLSHEELLLYRNDHGGFNGKFFINSDTKIISVPDFGSSDVNEAKKASKYNSYTISQLGVSGRMIVSAYSKDPDSCFAEILFVKMTSPAMDISTSSYVVKSVSTSVNDEGEEVRKVVAQKLVNQTEQIMTSAVEYREEVGKTCSLFEIAPGARSADTARYAVSEGDVILAVGCTASDTDIDAVQLLFKADINNPFGANGKKGFLTGGGSKYFIADKYYDSATNSLNLDPTVFPESLNTGNPYSYDKAVSAWNAFTDSDRILYGFVRKKLGKAIEVTTQDITQEEYLPTGVPLPLEYDASGKNIGIYVTERLSLETNAYGRLGGTLINLMELYDKGIYVRRGTLSDIKDYEKYRNDCSRVIANQTVGIGYWLLIINDYRS